MSFPLNTILGAATFGEWDNILTIKDPAVVQQILEFSKKNGIDQLDTARGYGSSEEVLGSLNVQEQGLKVDTKIRSFVEGIHAPEKVKQSAKESLQALKQTKVRILYLHSPDRATPLEDTLSAINDLYKEGVFEKFGLSNYTTEQVQEILKISREKNYVLPSVYQGNYNAFIRKNEETLFPLLKKEKISFYAYSPVAAGFVTLTKEQINEQGSRFDNSNPIGRIYQNWYFRESYFKALDKLTAIAQRHGLTNTEVAIRWIYYHSQLKKENGDSIIFGASPRAGIAQLESNLNDARKGPLPDEVVSVLEDIWNGIKADAQLP